MFGGGVIHKETEAQRDLCVCVGGETERRERDKERQEEKDTVHRERERYGDKDRQRDGRGHTDRLTGTEKGKVERTDRHTQKKTNREKNGRQDV